MPAERTSAGVRVIAPREARPLVVVSDIHLGAVPADTERRFREFLRLQRDRAAALLINGDLFDLWLATRHFVVRQHVRVLAALADLVEAGVSVLFVGGNHDALEYGGSTLAEQFGILTLDEPAHLVFGEHRLVVVHGDGVRAADGTYRKRHPVLRHPLFRWTTQRLLHLDRIADLVVRTSGTRHQVERHARGEDTGPKHAAPLLEAWARGALHDTPEADIALAGHSHLPALVEVSRDRFYVNSGDWISHMSYAEIPVVGPPVLRSWPS